MKTSYSQNNTFKMCPRHWEIRYKEGLQAKETGASLFFGTAIDAAIETLLLNKKNGTNDDYLQKFHDMWTRNIAFGKVTPVFDNPEVVYSNADFDPDVLQESDVNQLIAWFNVKDPKEHFKEVLKTKKNPYKRLSAKDQDFFARASWLSLRRKGELLIEAFKSQFLPKIRKVHSAQQRGDLSDPATGDSITGYIDMVVELEGHSKPIIMDLKTAARPYTGDNIEMSDQLTLYAAMKGPEYSTNLVGYVVLCKNINKEVVSHCKKCNAKKDGKHKTCNAIVDEVRCNGEWDTSIELKPEVQIMVESKTDKQINDLLMDFENIIICMKNNIVYRNTEKCKNWYGGKCAFFDYCHKGDKSGLICTKK